MKTRRIVILALLAFGAAALFPGVASTQSGPIKIGLLVPLTGAFSATGKDMLVGAELYLDEIGRSVGGRKIELIVEDTEGTPAGALTKSRKLVDQDKVHVLTGGLLASTGYALQPFVDAGRVPTTFPVIAADDLTQRKPARWIVRTGWTTSQPMHPFGEWVAKTLKYKRVVTIGMDYAFGLGDGGRLPARLRGERRADRAEAVDAAQHQRLQPVPGPDPARHRRGAGALRRAPGAAVHETI